MKTYAALATILTILAVAPALRAQQCYTPITSWQGSYSLNGGGSGACSWQPNAVCTTSHAAAANVTMSGFALSCNEAYWSNSDSLTSASLNDTVNYPCGQSQQQSLTAGGTGGGLSASSLTVYPSNGTYKYFPNASANATLTEQGCTDSHANGLWQLTPQTNWPQTFTLPSSPETLTVNGLLLGAILDLGSGGAERCFDRDLYISSWLEADLISDPFPEFESSVPLTDLQYSFCLLRESNEQQRETNRHRLPDDCDFRQRLAVSPRNYEDKTELILPLREKILVWEGHDLYAHHQRVPLGNSKVKALGITANSNSFASDFIYVDGQGREYHDDPRILENWYGYGKPIYAPGAGVVRASANDIPENWFEDAKATKIRHPRLSPGKDPKDIGNFVLLDHQNGEYSLLVHMKTGSLAVGPGDRVRQGSSLGSHWLRWRLDFSTFALFIDGRA